MTTIAARIHRARSSAGRLAAAVALLLVASPATRLAATPRQDPTDTTAAISATGPADTAIDARMRRDVERLIAKHRGVVGVAVVDPVTGDNFNIRGDESFPSASLVKLAVMVDVFARVEEGSLYFEDPLTFLDLDRTTGSGILQFLSAPKQLTVWDATFLMITLSDNAATNLILEKLPPRAVGQRMAGLGLPRTRIFVRVNADPDDSFAPDSARAFGLGTTTPNEIAALLTRIYRAELVSPEASARMLAILKHQFYREGLPRHLPPGSQVAHKTGSLPAARNDCGIVYGPRRTFVLCVMTKENEDRSWGTDNAAENLIGDIASLVYGRLNP